ncbi:MAG: lipid A biosynthesis acyltransferase, partial [Helicobacter sp.]|nr:lipid A biosynthesis acyltransferase [Helicobacter sp.]
FDLLVNLDFAYNNTLTQEQKQKILKTNYLNLVYNAISFFMLGVCSKKHILEMIEFDKPEIIDNLLQKEESIILVTGHFGNWEYTTPAFTCYFNHPITAVARMTPYPLINEYLLKVRSRFNISIFDKNGAAKHLIQALKNDKVVGIVTDQNTAENEGELVSFFGKKVRHTPIASLLARKFGAKIVCSFASYSQDYKKILIKVLPPIDYQKSENIKEDIYNLTQTQSNILEEIIKENPKDWLWFHKKFKNQYKEIYRRENE